ncbi:hypothetical protein O181_029550 [Austropuccinia psidii MF-1]|uniref:Uncharacterized protein n=1 Tax=Austropuccinia psidii MF-1 TaxID=1389203 RepID=A0A9Q3H5B1_9BASI|nr:hypothetical protein [Austropuccinia psidii MF-1]
MLRPIIDEIYELNNGLTIPTPEYPHGQKVAVKVVTLVGDIVAAHKAEGFKSNSANKLCSWFEVNVSTQQKLKLERSCTGRKFLEATKHWKDTLSKVSQEKVAIRTGVHCTGSMEENFMSKFCQRKRLEFFKDQKTDNEEKSLHKNLEFNDKTYFALLKYLKQSHPDLCDYSMLPHPDNSLVLRKFSRNLKSINWPTGLKLSMEAPNNFVKLKSGLNEQFGIIRCILDLSDPKMNSGPFIVLEEYELVNNREQDFKQVEMLLHGLDLAHVLPTQQLVFVPVSDGLGLAAYLQLPD